MSTVFFPNNFCDCTNEKTFKILSYNKGAKTTRVSPTNGPGTAVYTHGKE